MLFRSALIQGEYVDVFKAPKTDMTKASKKGFLDLVLDEGVPTTISCNTWFLRTSADSIMSTVFENGEVMNLATLEEIRERSDNQS